MLDHAKRCRVAALPDIEILNITIRLLLHAKSCSEAVRVVGQTQDR